MKKTKKQEPPDDSHPANAAHDAADDVQSLNIFHRHLRLGWWALFVFLTLGLVLESLHFLDVKAYLDTSNTTRRLMWTQAHAHGTLLGLINLGFAFTLPHLPLWKTASRRTASRLLTGATILMPAGFFLGGVMVHDGDPNPAILLLPIGGFMLFGAAWMATTALRRC